METFSALLALCEGKPLVTPRFPSQRPVMWSFDVFFHMRLNKWLSKHSRRWWFETPLGSLWRHCNVVLNFPGYFIVVHPYIPRACQGCHECSWCIVHNLFGWVYKRKHLFLHLKDSNEWHISVANFCAKCYACMESPLSYLIIIIMIMTITMIIIKHSGP